MPPVQNQIDTARGDTAQGWNSEQSPRAALAVALVFAAATLQC